MADDRRKCIGIMTSGGDAPGMNAAVRAVVRSALNRDVDVYAIMDGYQGMVDGTIKKMEWKSVSGILNLGGTVIGSARCKEFRERPGQKRAAANLVKNGIDRLVVIGGDGSLSGANEFSEEWSALLEELVADGVISREQADAHPALEVVGLVGSIDNDMANTDMTIGADTALHRITDLVDALASTAASHHRTFVVEVMGRNCGYLALIGAVATGASWVLIPEMPPAPGWEEQMCKVILSAIKAGRRSNIVIVAEGARDQEGNPISSAYVKEALEKGLQREVRLTIPGHVQRGGTPSAFDRNMSTIMGCRAVEKLLADDDSTESSIIGIRNNRPVVVPLVESVQKTRQVGQEIAAKNYDAAVELRGTSFRQMLDIFSTMMQPVPEHDEPDGKQHCFAILTAGRPASGMNPAIRTAVRVAMDTGHKVIGVQEGFMGLINDDIIEFDWMTVDDWIRKGGTELRTSRHVPRNSDLYMIAKNIEKYNIKGILMIGGMVGYEAVHEMYKHREVFPAFNIPIACIPATINNNLPGSEHSIGADTALNSIVESIDRIKESSDGSGRAFVVEVMGRYCGYLTVMSGLASGAEVMYTHEEGITLEGMCKDLERLSKAFKQGRNIALIIRNECANDIYNTDFICSLFEEAGGSLFDVRKTVLGPIQQGGAPTPYDRVQGTRLAYEGMKFLLESVDSKQGKYMEFGMEGGFTARNPVSSMSKMVEWELQRPVKQWWMDVLDMAHKLALPKYDE
ncbi:MAG: 6-phosphofructokinase [Victivallales bacterium]|nr:6-phosphofructokinase [Victivallales bacterium]